MSDSTRRTNPVDRIVGDRVRLRRRQLGLTQAKLAERVELSVQQVQKYETGFNRIGASRLQDIATALDVPVSFFFEDAPKLPVRAAGRVGNAAGSDLDFLNSAEGLQLNRAFVKISDVEIRRCVVDLVKTLADMHARAR